MHYVVAGVGYTGRRVLDALPAAFATGLNRSPIEGAAVQVVDFDRPDALPLPAPPFTILYTVPPPSDGDRDARLERFLDRLDHQGERPARIVYLSTSGVYGDRGGAFVDELAEPAPRTARAERRRAAEMRLEQWCTDRGTELTILRVPAIYGPGRLGLDRLSAGEPVIREADAAPGNRIHVVDLARCCVVAMTATAPVGICNVGDGDHRSSGAFSRAVAALAGLDAPPEISMQDARETFSPGRLSFLDESRRLDVTKMREVLGVEPRYADPEDGIRASLAADA